MTTSAQNNDVRWMVILATSVNVMNMNINTFGRLYSTLVACVIGELLETLGNIKPIINIPMRTALPERAFITKKLALSWMSRIIGFYSVFLGVIHDVLFSMTYFISNLLKRAAKYFNLFPEPYGIHYLPRFLYPLYHIMGLRITASLLGHSRARWNRRKGNSRPCPTALGDHTGR